MRTDRRGFVLGALLAPLGWRRTAEAAPIGCDCCDVMPSEVTVTISGFDFEGQPCSADFTLARNCDDERIEAGDAVYWSPDGRLVKALPCP